MLMLGKGEIYDGDRICLFFSLWLIENVFALPLLHSSMQLLLVNKMVCGLNLSA